MFLGIQLIGILFGIFMAYMTYLHLKRNEFNRREFIFWIFLWIVFLVITINPGMFDSIIRGLKIIRVMDLLTIVGFMFLLGLNFHIYSIARKNETKLEKVVREVAIKNWQKDDSNKTHKGKS